MAAAIAAAISKYGFSKPMSRKHFASSFKTGAAVLSLQSVLLFAATNVNAEAISLSEKLAALQQAFPDRVTNVSGKSVVFSDGTKVAIDDGLKKSHRDKLKNADVEDMFSQVYPLGACVKGKPARNFDPGRIRNDRVMRALFGQNKADARRNQTTVNWFGQRLPFARIGGADKALKQVIQDLTARVAKKPGLKKFLRPSAGTFVWRNIAGTKRLSVHSFGAAIDINTKFTNYWRWGGGKPGNVPKYQNKIPLEIVRIFEKHGFIWGGHWYHYDTMHFEFRPDLIAIGRLSETRGCSG